MVHCFVTTDSHHSCNTIQNIVSLNLFCPTMAPFFSLFTCHNHYVSSESMSKRCGMCTLIAGGVWSLGNTQCSDMRWFDGCWTTQKVSDIPDIPLTA